MHTVIMRSVITARISVQCVPHHHAHGLTLVPYLEPSIVKSHSPRERHGTPRNRPTRTGRQQQGRAPNQDKRRLGARPAAAAVAGPEDEGATLYWLVIVNERMRWLGWGSGDADAGLPMRLGHWMYMWRWPWHAARGWTGCMALSERWSWPWAWALI